MAEARSHKAEQAQSTHTGERDRIDDDNVKSSGRGPRATLGHVALRYSFYACTGVASVSSTCFTSSGSSPQSQPASHTDSTPCMGQMSMRSSRASTGQPRIPRLIRNTQRIPRHKWCSTEPLLSALPALLGVTDTGTGPRCQGLPGTAEAHRGEAAAAEGAAAGKRDRAPTHGPRAIITIL